TVVIDRGDVARAKPEPDLFVMAAQRLSVPAEECYVVGDAVWDLLAARRGRMFSVGLLTGGYGADELLAAGADRGYRRTAALLAGDRAALLGGDDLPPHLLELVARRGQPGRQRIALRQPPRALRRSLLRRIDAVDERAHVGEKRRHLERRLVVLAAVVERIRGPPIERDLDARLHALVSLAQPHRVGPRHHARTSGTPVRHRRRAGDARRLVL